MGQGYDDIMRHHVVITGTGRAGTTFLVFLLTVLDLDTGFNKDKLPLFAPARAGLERILKEDAPYIVKNPWFCDCADEIVQRDDIIIDHVFVPMRDLHAAAESRRYVVDNAPKELKLRLRPSEIPGGLWHTDDRSQQEAKLVHQLYKLMYSLSVSEIPITLMQYPRITKDPEYLYRKLSPLVFHIPYDHFVNVFNRIVRPGWVHSFNENDV